MIWSKIKYFSPNENWGDPKKMNPFLLFILDALREQIGKPFIIHCGYATSGHVPNSQHYLGNAVDFHIKWDISFPEQVRQFLRVLEDIDAIVMTRYGVIHDVQIANLCGLGIYPDWKNPGFHLDLRGERARWGRINGKYVSLDEALVWAEERGL